MKQFSPSALLLAGGFVLLALFAYLPSRNAGSPPAPNWTSVEEAVAPSSENVDPSFHARLMTLRTQLDAAPEDTILLLEAARLQQDAHQHEESAASYERYLALAPDNRQVWLDLANVYAGMGRWDEAQRVSNALLERVPNDPSAMYNLGAIAANQDNPTEARQWWARVRDGSDTALATQATNSLAQLDRSSSGQTTQRPAASRPPPHAAPGQPVMAHPATSLAVQE